MGGIWTAQSNFTKGELDPKLLGRVDLEAFYQGVQEATNMLAIPQGGMKKRPGTLYIDDALGDGRLEAFSFNVEQVYLLVFTASNMRVYKDGVLQTTVSTPWTTIEQIRSFDFIQSADTIIITHPDVQPRRIVRNSDVSWTISTLPLVNIPQYDYNDGLSPTPSSEVQDLQIFGMEQGSTIKLGLEGVLTDDFSYEGPNSNMAEAIRDQLQTLPNTASTGISVSFTGGAEFNATFRVTLGGASAKNWRLITGFLVQGTTTGDERINSSRISTGTARTENVWSSTRGWPVSATFHEGRLWFGGSKSRPSTIWGSNVNDVFNFDVGRARADQAIDVTLGTDQVNAVTSIFSNKSLQVFTSGAEFYVPESPVTPENVAVRPQTNLGSKRVRPVALEGLTLFLQRTGRALYQFQFVDEFQSNESRSLSIAAPHLINDPVQMYVSRGTSETDANYVYLVGSDGNLTVFNTQSYEGIQAFTRWTTQGSVKSAAVVSNELYLLVERDGNYYIDKADSTLNTDSAVVSLAHSGTTLTGLTHLEGETVTIKIGGTAQPDAVVSGGQITLARDPNGEDVEAGLSYFPKLKTMPLSMQLNNGPNAAQKKRILRCAIRVDESNGVLVNGERIADKTIGLNQFDAPQPISQFKRVFLHGWSLDATVEITQTTPFPLTVLALNLEVKV